MTPGIDVMETQDDGPPGIGYSMVNQSGLFIKNDSLEAAWFPSQKLARLLQLRRRSEFTSMPVPEYHKI